MEIIGFTGQAQSGKSYAADYICRLAFKHGSTPHRVSFAGALKRAAEEAGFHKELKPKEYRKFCQEEGAARRKENPNYWVNKTLAEICSIKNKEFQLLEEGLTHWEQIVVIDDVRYQNEIDAIIRMGGTMCHVTAGDRLPTPTARWRNHESEKLAKALDKTKGKGERFASYFKTVMPWGKPCEEVDVFWFDNSTTREEFEMLLEASYKLMVNREHLCKEARESLDINNMSGEEREQLMDFLADMLDQLTDEVPLDDDDLEDLEDDADTQ